MSPTPFLKVIQLFVCTFEFLLRLVSGFAFNEALFCLLRLALMLNGVWLLSGKSCFTLMRLPTRAATMPQLSPYFFMCWISPSLTTLWAFIATLLSHIQRVFLLDKFVIGWMYKERSTSRSKMPPSSFQLNFILLHFLVHAH